MWLNHGAVAVTSELDPAGLPLTGLLLAFSSISAFALIAAFAAMYSVSKVGGSWGGSLRSGLAPQPARLHRGPRALDHHVGALRDTRRA